MIKAIETVYKGFKFRSRLEARYAVFFDALGISWEYEPEGFELSDGTKYLPDFRLPNFSGGIWVEVKYTGGDFSKAIQFANDSEEWVMLCEGTPSTNPILCARETPDWAKAGAHNGEYSVCPDCDIKFMGCPPYPCWLSQALPNCNDDARRDGPEGRLWWEPGPYDHDEYYVAAVTRAKQARFEFGECG